MAIDGRLHTEHSFKGQSKLLKNYIKKKLEEKIYK